MNPFRRILRRRSVPLSREHAAGRITAYVYGTTIVLAAVIPLSQENAESGLSALIVLGASLTTYFAHVLGEMAGHRVRSDTPLSHRDLLGEMQDSLPILTSGLIPAAILALAWFGGLPGLVAQLAAEIYVIVRLARTGFVIERIRGERPSVRMYAVSLVLAGMALIVSLLKVTVANH